MKGVLLAMVALAGGLGAVGDWTLSPLSSAALREVPSAPLSPNLSGGETDADKIDLLFVFDAAARRHIAPREPRDYARSCVDDLNASLAYTGIDRHFTFRAADVLDLSPHDLGDRELADVIATFSPKLGLDGLDAQTAERIRAARDDSRADIVVILTTGRTPNIYGYATSLTPEDLASDNLDRAAEMAYCACRIDAIRQRHTLLHEIGHLFGAGHSDTQNKTPGPLLFPWSSAYRFHAGDTPLTTVTGYPEGKAGIILPFFSSPDYALSWTGADGVAIRDIPVGTPTNDNTRTLISTYPLVAQYRAARPTEADARFDRELAFTLSEDGSSPDVRNGAIALRCGVRRVFSLEGLPRGVSVRVARLPAGFAYDAKRRLLSGRASKPGDYAATFVFVRENGGLRVRRRVMFHVESLPAWATGRFATEDGKAKITVSDQGSIRLSRRKGYRDEKTSQSGFIREETDDDGCPVFVFEDGKRLSRPHARGTADAVITDADGTVYKPVKAPARKRRAFKDNNKTKT